MKRLLSPSALRLGTLLCAAWLAGCASLSPAPPVDVLPTTPPALTTQPRMAPQPATGSLYQQASYRPMFEDRRARMVGDMVTIQIVENITASQKSSSTVDRSSDVSGGITALPFVGSSFTDKTKLAAKSGNAFAGKGGTESANKFEGSITTTVIDVLPNGHLVVAGEKQIGVNQNVDVLRFSGIVNPATILGGNVVSSTQVADARMEQRGRGDIGRVQGLGWLSRFFLSIAPV